MYVWFDALINYITAVGYGADGTHGVLRSAREVLAGAVPLRRQGHHPVPLRDLAGDADGRWAAAPGEGLRPRLPAHQGREDVEVEGQRRLAGGAGRALRRGRLPLLLPARGAVRRRRLDLDRVDGAALQRRPGQRLGQPRLAPAQHDREVLRRPRPAAGGAGGRGRRDRGDRRGPARGVRGADARARLRRRAGGGVGAREAREPLHRGLRSVEPRQVGRHAVPSPDACCSPRSRRSGSRRCSRRRSCPTPRARCGAVSASGDPSTVVDAATEARWGGLPVGSKVEKGEPLFPRIYEETE